MCWGRGTHPKRPCLPLRIHHIDSPLPQPRPPEALHLGLLLLRHGYLYPLRVPCSLALQLDGTLYRFQVRLSCERVETPQPDQWGFLEGVGLGCG